MMRLHNTSNDQINLKAKYTQEESWKPRGLYWGIDNEWLEWCSSEMPECVEQYNFSLEINESDIYQVHNIESLLIFTKEFTITKYYNINWEAVALKYKGFEIINYHSLLHLKNQYLTDYTNLWIYGWDVNGGCVWDLSAVKFVEKVNK